MDMSRYAASSSSNPTATKRRLILDVVDEDELPSPIPSPVHLAVQQPRPMEMEAPAAALSSKTGPMVIDLEELPSPTSPPSLAASSSKPRTVEAIFADFSSRREALIRALTTDQEEFFGLCDPGEVGLLLYAHADGNWEVMRPDEVAPPSLPEPAMGLNWVRDKMTRFDWLSRVAVRADSWLAGLSQFFGATLNADQRMLLFDMIIDLPTVNETFAQFYKHDSACWLPTNMPPSPDLMNNVYKQNNSSRAPAEENVPLSSDLGQNVSNPGSGGGRKEIKVGQPPYLALLGPPPLNPGSDSMTHDEDNDEELEVSDQTFCAACGAPYHANGFWIGCDICDRWFHGKCVKITASEAEYIHQYKCPDCKREEIGE